MKYFIDTLLAGVKYLMSNICDQLFTDGKYIYIHTMKSKKEAGDGLQNFTGDVGNSSNIMRNNTSK